MSGVSDNMSNQASTSSPTNDSKGKKGKRKLDTINEKPAKKKVKRECDAGEEVRLNIPLLLSQQHHLDLDVSANISCLLEEDHKVSFIARYRKAQTNDIEPELLHEVAASHTYLKGLQTAVSRAYTQLRKESKVTPELRQALVSVSKKSHLDMLMEPHKKGPRTTLASRARSAGLEPAALQLLYGTGRCQPTALLQPGCEGRATLAQVQAGLGHIICDVISKNVDVQQKVVQLASHPGIHLESKQKLSKTPPTDDQSYRYRNYWAFRKPVRLVRSFEYLAICRAEEQKYVTVRVDLPQVIAQMFTDFCLRHILSSGVRDEYRRSVVEQSVSDVFAKTVSRQLERQTRSSLREAAEREAMLVMSRNLKAKLLTPPIRGRVILAMDPGFRACKLAVVSAQGDIQQTTVIHPRLDARWPAVSSDPAADQLRDMIRRHQVTLLGIGNGTACRETWQYVVELNGSGWLAGSPLDVTLVDEGGASVYSATKAASADMPDLDCTVRSAVSLARRLQDPLSEYVKMDVTCLGVGMYQKDMPAGQVRDALGEVLSDCVGTVGVDLNTASALLLKKVPGLNAASAENIVIRRQKSLFANRQQLRDVKGIGPKSFEQCAGFVRVLPITSAGDKVRTMTPKKGRKAASLARELLDQTIIHPESYQVAYKLLKRVDCSADDIGTDQLASRLTELVGSSCRQQLAQLLDTDVHTLGLIVQALCQPGYDERQDRAAPMFWKTAMHVKDVRPGARLTGVVRNPTEFGAFVDLGIGESGLIHTSQMNSTELRVNDHVQVEVIKVEQKRQKVDIGLRLIAKLDGRAVSPRQLGSGSVRSVQV